MARFYKRFVMLLTVVPIVLAGSYCLSWQQLSLFHLATSADGRIFGIVHASRIGGDCELREWSPDLNREATVCTIEGLRFTCAADGGWLAVSGYRQIPVIETDTGRIQSVVSHRELNGRPLALLQDGQYFATHGIFDWKQNKTLLLVLRASDSVPVVERSVPGKLRLKAAGDRLAYCNDAGELVVLEISDSGVREVLQRTAVNCFALTKDGRMLVVDFGGAVIDIDREGNERPVPKVQWLWSLFDVELVGSNLLAVDRAGRIYRIDATTGGRHRVASLGKPPADFPLAIAPDFVVSAETLGKLTVSDLQTGVVRQRELQPMQRGEMTLVLFAFGIAFMIWSWCLLRDGRHSGHRWRAWLDIAIILALLHVVWLGNSSLYIGYYTFSFGFVMFIVAVWGVVGSVLAFAASLNSRHSWVPHIVFAISFVVLPLLPVAAVGLLLRWLGWRVGHADTLYSAPKIPRDAHVSRERFRFKELKQFSVRQLLLGITACAATLGIGRYLIGGNTEFLLAGVGFAVLLGVGLLFAASMRWSHGVLAASLLSLAVGCAGFSILKGNAIGTSSFLIVAVSTMSLLCSHVRLAGYVVRR